MYLTASDLTRYLRENRERERENFLSLTLSSLHLLPLKPSTRRQFIPLAIQPFSASENQDGG